LPLLLKSATSSLDLPGFKSPLANSRPTVNSKGKFIEVIDELQKETYLFFTKLSLEHFLENIKNIKAMNLYFQE
jgi:hypothetical protein